MSADMSDLARGCGYLEGAGRPSCGNCGGRNATSDCCNLHVIPIKAEGWCPIWCPTVDWGRQNRDAMAYMGLSMGDSLRSSDHGLQREGA